MADAKAQLRQTMRRRLAAVSPAAVRAHSRAACRRLWAAAPVRTAAAVAAYAAFGPELDLQALVRELLRAGRLVAYPRYAAAGDRYELALVENVDQDLVPGQYGIAEPGPGRPVLKAAVRRRLVWLVPGLAFDLEGRRLGRGKGYYDRLLAGGAAWTIGVGHDWQVVPRVPAEAHDVRLDQVGTDARLITCQVTAAPPETAKE